MSNTMVRAAIEEYRTAIGEGWENLVDGRGLGTDLDIADASRFLAGLVEGALTFVHGDPARPLLVPWTTADRRWADNGADSAYWYAPLDGAHRYRLCGRRHEECYLSFTVYAGNPAHPDRVARNVNHHDLGAGPGEEYELEITPPADACYVIARQYFHHPATAVRATMQIEVIDGPPPAVPGPDAIAARWRDAASFVRRMTAPPAPVTVSYGSTVTNRVGAPSGWREEEGAGRGTPDQTYALGRFELGPGEALVMDARIPRGVYSSVVLWNQFGQTLDTRLHTATLNDAELVTRPDGTVRVVVAHDDPGVPNWLDAAGRTRGSIFWRFLRAEEPPEPIRSHVVPLAEVVSLP